MLYLSAHQLTFRYPTQVDPLFRSLSFQLRSQSRVGLIGRNGVGKSTLLQLLLGQLTPGTGTLTRHPDLQLGYLPQAPGSHLLAHFPEATSLDLLWQARPELNALRQSLQAEVPDLAELARFDSLGGYEFETEAARHLSALGGEPEWLERPLCSLSGGERARVGLCLLQLQAANVYLLDEPGNDLDAPMLDWLSEFLLSSQVPYLLVSHDRRLLDSCCAEIWELQAGSLQIRQGNYAAYRAQCEQEQAHQQRLYAQERKKITRLQAAAQNRRQQAERHETFKPSRSRKKNGGLCKRDDGSGGALRVGHLMRAAKATETRLERASEAAEALRPNPQRQSALHFQAAISSRKPCLQLDKLSYKLAGHRLFGPLQLSLSAGQCLVLTGPNGSGKSTLLRYLLSQHPHAEPADFSGQFSGHVSWHSQLQVGYFAQTPPPLPLERSALSWVQTFAPSQLSSPASRQQAQTLLACLGLGPDLSQQPLATLSRGEQSKVLLAALLLQQPEILLLDEPTNHLELPAREALETALQAYPGALILVSHDRTFCEALADQQVELKPSKWE